ncbi:MAG: hypothetical protein HYV45_01820 [Candidatus Moranbacteria bacterium]|nr:hypothetical protein [Candidatus Moranbacteria bacterium]
MLASVSSLLWVALVNEKKVMSAATVNKPMMASMPSAKKEIGVGRIQNEIMIATNAKVVLLRNEETGTVPTVSPISPSVTDLFCTEFLLGGW